MQRRKTGREETTPAGVSLSLHKFCSESALTAYSQPQSYESAFKLRTPAGVIRPRASACVEGPALGPKAIPVPAEGPLGCTRATLFDFAPARLVHRGGQVGKDMRAVRLG